MTDVHPPRGDDNAAGQDRRTDAAVTAAAEAIDGPGSTYLIQRGHVDLTDVERIVAAARPIIEAEVRERIAEQIEASACGCPCCDIAARIAGGQA